jgi:hypothetical protein
LVQRILAREWKKWKRAVLEGKVHKALRYWRRRRRNNKHIN